MSERDATSSNLIRKVELDFSAHITALALSADEKSLFVWGDSSYISQWSLDTGKPIGKSIILPMTVVFNPDGKTTLAGGNEHAPAQLWDLQAGQPTGSPWLDAGTVGAAAFSPDGKSVLTVGRSRAKAERKQLPPKGQAVLWNLGTGTQAVPPMRLPGPATGVAFNADGRRLLTDSQGAFQSWATETGKPIGGPIAHPGRVLALSPDRMLAALAKERSQVQLWDIAGGKPIGPILWHEGEVRTAAFSPDGKILVTGSGNPYQALVQVSAGEPEFWDVATGKMIRPTRFTGRHEILAVTFSPNGKLVLTGSKEKIAHLWQPTVEWSVGPPFRNEAAVVAVAFSPDGKKVLTGSADGAARLWETTSGKPIGQPLLHRGSVSRTAFSPDGTMALTAGDDGAARLWDAATGRPLGPPLQHRGPVIAATFNQAGALILTLVSNDSAVNVSRPPASMPGDPQRILRWAEVITAMEVDDTYAVHPLDVQRWETKRKQLAEMGGSPLP